VTSQHIYLLLFLVIVIIRLHRMHEMLTVLTDVLSLNRRRQYVCGSFGADFIKYLRPRLTIIITKFVLHTDVFYERVSLFFSIFIVVYVVCVCVSFQDPA